MYFNQEQLKLIFQKLLPGKPQKFPNFSGSF